jgi:hypothetical protein
LETGGWCGKMLHILLLILKIIGLLILSIIGLLLTVLLIVLFVPIRYKVTAEHGEEFRLEGRANWLLHLINAKFSHLEGVFHVRVRILWFLLYDNLKPKQPADKVKKQKKAIKRNRNRRKQRAASLDSNKKEKKNISSSHKKEETEIKNEKQATINHVSDHNLMEVKKNTSETIEIGIDQSDGMNRTLPIKDETVSDYKSDDNTYEDEEHNQKENFTKEKKKVSIFQRILSKMRNVKDKLLRFFAGVKNKIVKLFETVVNIKQKIGLISDFIQNEINREGFKITYSSVKKLLKHILPTKLKSKIIFGTGDPCSTGQALGVMGILYSFYGDKVQITPDFENKRLEGSHYARGRIRLITILIIVIKLIIDKRFKQLKSNFQILKEAL